jgi:hypothetical protein
MHLKAIQYCFTKAWIETLVLGLENASYIQLKGREDIHGHRTLKAPHPVRSAKLTRVPPS